MAEDLILVERPEGGLALVRLNRPKALNALNAELMRELAERLHELDADGGIRCIVLTGSKKAFAAGADIGEMKDATAVEMFVRDHLRALDRVGDVRTPIVAAVSGWALGGGCELAMACDIVMAAEGARFGQPEIDIGIMPGAGGTQRLPRAVGKSLAMEMILAGRKLTADEALARGLVSRVVRDDELLDSALELAGDVAKRPPVAVRAAKEAVNRSFDLTVEDGLAYERNLFFLLFASEDRTEGMSAFTEKRTPEWRGR